MTTTLEDGNRIAVPEEIVREMGLEPGARFCWAKGADSGTLTVQVKPSVRQLLARAQEIGRQLKKGPFSGRDLIEELVAERALEVTD